MTTRTFRGLDVSEDDIKEFQANFVGSAMGTLVGRVLSRVVEVAQESLENCGAGDVTMRQAQGAIAAVRMFDEITAAIANENLDEPPEELGEDDISLGGIDVGF